VLPGLELTFRDAGHILGSASVWLRLREGDTARSMVFSGDLGQYDSPILRDPEPGVAVDLVVMESTYGERLHRDREATLREFGDILRGARADGGNVLIPAFAVGRSQDVLYELGTHFDEWELGDWQIFLDSPMAIEASEVYWKLSDHFDEEAQALRNRAAAMPPLPNLNFAAPWTNGWRSTDLTARSSSWAADAPAAHHPSPPNNLARPECDVVFTGSSRARSVAPS
jgi:metallo-beta-lactamase family protein